MAGQEGIEVPEKGVEPAEQPLLPDRPLDEAQHDGAPFEWS